MMLNLARVQIAQGRGAPTERHCGNVWKFGAAC